MIKENRKTEVFETTLGELIMALLEAAGEISTNTLEIESLAYQTLSSLLSPGTRSNQSETSTAALDCDRTS